MKAIMLVLTENCNLACKYCYECGESHMLTLETAKKIIDYELSVSSKEQYKVFFFGGEPFVNFNTLEKIYDYIEETYPGKVNRYAVTTNGTLIHSTIKNWLYERREKFEITLSIDGTRDMHNRNRITKAGRGSYDDIDLDFFVGNWQGCIAKMTISPDTIYDFAEGIISIEQRGFKCKANFASGVNFNLEKNKGILLDNFRKLIEYYSQNDTPLCYMLDLPLTSILVPLDEKFRYCGAGVERHCYGDEEREWYPCQGLMPMSLPDRSERFKFENFSDGSIMENSTCRTCKFIRICRTCYAMNYSSTQNVFYPGSQTCKLNKMCMLASARIQYNRLKKQKHSNDLLEKAIFFIAKDLNNIFE